MHFEVPQLEQEIVTVVKGLYVDLCGKHGREFTEVDFVKILDRLPMHFATPLVFKEVIESYDAEHFKILIDLLIADYDGWHAPGSEPMRSKFGEFRGKVDPYNQRLYETYQTFVKILNEARRMGGSVKDILFLTPEESRLLQDNSPSELAH